MITAQIEAYSDCIDEMKEMYHDHWRALALNQDKVPLDPMYEVYFAREAAGETLVATLRDEGKMAGYFIGFVAPGLHYRTCLTLIMDAFWVQPDYRNKWGGVKLFRAVEKEARRRGVDRVFYGSKVHSDASKLFEFLECEKVEVYYSKWIGD